MEIYVYFLQISRPITLKKEGIQTRNRRLANKGKRRAFLGDSSVSAAAAHHHAAAAAAAAADFFKTTSHHHHPHQLVDSRFAAAGYPGANTSAATGGSPYLAASQYYAPMSGYYGQVGQMI